MSNVVEYRGCQQAMLGDKEGTVKSGRREARASNTWVHTAQAASTSDGQRGHRPHLFCVRETSSLFIFRCLISTNTYEQGNKKFIT